jgi:PAS domain S-box-containing protein
MDSKRDETQDISKLQRKISLFPNGISIDSSSHNTPVGIWEEYSEITKNRWSAAVYSILEIDKGSVSAPTISVLAKHIPVPDKQRVEEIIGKISRGDLAEAVTIEFRYKSPKAKTKYLVLIAEPATSTAGTKYFCGTIQDISIVRNCEVDFNNYVQSALNYFEKFPLLMIIMGENGKLSYWNNECERVTGYRSTDLSAGKEVFKLLFPVMEIRKRFRDALQDKDFEVFDEEFEIETRRGRKFLSKWTVFPFSSADGEHNIAAIGRDISKQVVREIALESKLQQSKIVNKVASSLMMLSPEENYFHHLGVTLENHFDEVLFIISSAETDQQFFTIEGGYGFSSYSWQQLYEVIGWNPIGRRYQLPPQSLAIAQSIKVQAIEQSIYNFTDGMISSAASRNFERILSIHKIYALGIYSESKLFGWMLIVAQSPDTEQQIPLIQQITKLYAQAMQRREGELEIRKAKSIAEDANRLKSAYLANFGHEIRTPMNAILGFTQLLNIPNLNKEKKKQYIDIVNSKGRMLVKLINDMVDVSRVESGQLTIIKSLFYPNRLLRNLKDFYSNERLFQHREAVDIRLVLPPQSDDFSLYGDEGRLEQVFTNLLDNALKFTQKGFIEFGYTINESTVEFYVQDSGIGIDPAMHSMVFDRYMQLDKRIERVKEGKGLGLAISKGIVDLMGGNIWVESEPGQGATFRFEIPIDIEDDREFPEPEVEMEQEPSSLPDWKNKVLLIAEDEEINYLLISEMLESTGVNLLWAKDGAQAVELVNGIKNIDAILMDIRMPNKDGYAASLEIRQINPSIPIVAQTAYAFSEDRAKAEAAGCNDYITKPVNSHQLLSILDKYLG